MKKTVCELFAGVGGFRLGLEKSSQEWNTVWANQWEPGKLKQHAFDCYCKHFGDKDIHVNKDISNIEKSKIPDHNLLVGGFPCQDYSVARSLSGEKGINGKKGILWWQIRDILEAKNPTFVLLENVDRLLKSPSTQRGRDFGVMLTCFNELGYNVEWRVLNAAEYGAVQRRRRTFIFAYKNTSTYAGKLSKLSEDSIIKKDGFFARTFPIHQDCEIQDVKFAYKDIVEVSDKFQWDFGNTGLLHNGSLVTTNTLPIQEKSRVILDILQSDVDNKYFLGDALEKWIYLKGAKKIERTSKTGHKYIFSEGPIAFPDPLDKPARTMLTSESSLNRSTHVIRDPQNGKMRLITPIEAERIQGFDDDWTNTGMPEKFRYFCMGNALVVDIVEKMGKTLNVIFDREK